MICNLLIKSLCDIELVQLFLVRMGVLTSKLFTHWS